jgi:hypothetical protein
VRYLAQRLVEQQDPATLLAGSGASRLDPVSAVIEGQRVAWGHQHDRQPTFQLASEVLGAVRSSLRAHNADLSAGFPVTYAAACAALDAALAGTRAALAAGVPTLASSALPDSNAIS